MMIVCLPFTPESPLWFARKGRVNDASRALQRINHSQPGYTPQDDLELVAKAVRTERATASESTWMSLIREPIERRKLIFSCGAMIAQQINGIQFFYSYGVVFAQSIGISQP